MSLQICPNCKHENSYWRVYKKINFKHFKNGMGIKCENCNKKMILQNKKRGFFSGLICMILWMSPAFFLIYLVASNKLNFLLAIILITLFHFIIFYFIIKNYNYEKVK